MSVSRPKRVTLAVILTVTAGSLAGWYQATSASEPPIQPPPMTTDTLARAPRGTRIRVRVLNATRTQGLAKRASFVLRDFGYDVVDFDSNAGAPRTSTLVLTHTGHADWAQRLRRALGTGTIETRVDSLRYVDFTVLVGSDWKAPTKAFRP
ncbi:MAG: LytR C-terminal domain-containing protein [Gemmatimonadaceae bacterium]|nr:LytR C-terminal domain-containing protein [Gemmatimonadaceae bacterium]